MKRSEKHGNTKTYKVVNAMFFLRKSSGIAVIWLMLKLLKEKKLE
tara:strand:- start:566 stop:700 length:135 start_codon:yes stop_codon:yes gene_type:complete